MEQKFEKSLLDTLNRSNKRDIAEPKDKDSIDKRLIQLKLPNK